MKTPRSLRTQKVNSDANDTTSLEIVAQDWKHLERSSRLSLKTKAPRSDGATSGKLIRTRSRVVIVERKRRKRLTYSHNLALPKKKNKENKDRNLLENSPEKGKGKRRRNLWSERRLRVCPRRERYEPRFRQ